MKWMCRLAAVAAAFVLAGSVSTAARAQSDEDPYQALRQYDFQHRAPSHAIMLQIQAAGSDRSKQDAIESGLIGVISDPNATFAGKQEACRFLWQVGSGRSVPAVAKLLPDPKLSNIARYALERNPDPAAAAALRAALKTTYDAPLIGLINSVGDRADALAVPALRHIALGTDRPAADAATAALGKIATPAALAALRAIPGKGLVVDNAMLRCAERMSGAGDRSAALAVYEALSWPAYPDVIRAGALEGLARLHGQYTDAVALKVARTASSPELQGSAAHIAGMLPAAADTQRGIAAFRTLPPAAQAALLGAWAERHATAAAPVALAALSSPDPEVRRTAIQTSAAIGGPAAVTRLADMAAGGDDSGVARECLARMHGAGVEPAILRAAEQDRPEVRAAMLGVLVQRPTPAVNAALMAGATGMDRQVAVAALHALAQTARPSDEPRLVAILTTTQSDDVRDAAYSAVVAVAQRTTDRDAATQPLIAALPSASTAAKVGLLGALADMGGSRALDVLTQATTSSDADVKSAAITSLSNSWSDPSAMPTLLTVAHTEQNRSMRVLALRGYLRIAGSADRAPADTRLEWVQQAMALAERPDEKRQALSVLRDVRLPGAVELAAKSLDDPDVNAEAADTIIDLASAQRRNRRYLPAVTGASTTAALEKVVRTSRDDSVKSRAQKLLPG